MPTQGALGLDGFTRLTARQQMNVLFGVCSSPIWARRVLAGGPFHDVDALLDRADRVLAELPDAEIDAALDGHPRIGAKADNASSAREQAAVVTAADSGTSFLAKRRQQDLPNLNRTSRLSTVLLPSSIRRPTTERAYSNGSWNRRSRATTA